MDYDQISLLLFAVGVYRCLLLSPVMIQECKAVFGLMKWEKESCFLFVNNGNLGRKACVWLMLIEKGLES